jgi:hypothetical protein
VTVVPSPGEVWISTVPPASWARSCMPISPKPLVLTWASKPRPSSRTVTQTLLVVFFDLDECSLRTTVFVRVVEGFLDDPVHRGLEFGGVAIGPASVLVGEIDRELHSEPPVAGALGEVSDGCLGTKLIERGGATRHACADVAPTPAHTFQG